MNYSIVFLKKILYYDSMKKRGFFYRVEKMEKKYAYELQYSDYEKGTVKCQCCDYEKNTNELQHGDYEKHTMIYKHIKKVDILSGRKRGKNHI